jgi:C-terminal processing protease CtpA/Prc
MRAFADAKPRGYILDLRHNPGGLLDSAQGVLGLFYDGTALYETTCNWGTERISHNGAYVEQFRFLLPV